MKVQVVNADRRQIPLFYPALQRGVFVKARLGGSIRSFLCEQLGLDPDYVKNRIQTAFLNGKPVDDFDKAAMGEGAVLTVSGALPGLAGATLRKGGFYSPLRASLSHKNETGLGREEDGFITLKIFNILLPELSPALLARGIYFSGDQFASFLRELPPEEQAVFRNLLGGQTPESGSPSAEKGKTGRAGFIEVRVEE